MSNNFCKFLSNGARIQTDWGRLRVAPCCYWKGEWVYLDDPNFDSKFTKIHNALSCTDCHQKTIGDLKSPRERSFIDVPGDYNNGDPVFLELSLSIECNAACLSCDDNVSSTWVEQNKKFGIKTIHDYPDPQDDDQVIDALFNKYNFHNVRTINFLGGEPLWDQRNTTTVKFLERLVGQIDPSNVTISFTTNGSKKPSAALIELLRKFNQVNWFLSLDGTADQFEYLRYPLRWDAITDTVRFIAGLDLKQNIVVNTTVSALNVFYYDRIVKWANSMSISCGLPDLPVAAVPCNGIMSTYNITPEFNNQLHEKYKNTQKILDLLPPPHDITVASRGLITYLDRMDNFRRLSWRNTFPEIVGLLESESDK